MAVLWPPGTRLRVAPPPVHALGAVHCKFDASVRQSPAFPLNPRNSWHVAESYLNFEGDRISLHRGVELVTSWSAVAPPGADGLALKRAGLLSGSPKKGVSRTMLHGRYAFLLGASVVLPLLHAPVV